MKRVIIRALFKATITFVGVLVIIAGLYFMSLAPAFRSGISKSVQIDWISFIKFNDITYTQVQAPTGILENGLIYFDEVRFKIADNVSDPNYHTKNGDATFLEPGTIIYLIKDYSSDFRLMAESGELYEADTNPRAKTGADLLDIGDKVAYIGINSVMDGKTELASIKDKIQVQMLVQMVLDAPVNQKINRHGSMISSFVFYLKDGTVVNRSYSLDTGELQRGILLPDEFGQAIKAALK